MMPDLLVYAVMALSATFVIVWALSPKLRARIEAPKHLFVEDIQRYDRIHHD